jgi:hypothetical protein
VTGGSGLSTECSGIPQVKKNHAESNTNHGQREANSLVHTGIFAYESSGVKLRRLRPNRSNCDFGRNLHIAKFAEKHVFPAWLLHFYYGLHQFL